MYAWPGMRKLNWTEVIKMHLDKGLAGIYKLYSDDTEAEIMEDYSWNEIFNHFYCGGEFGEEIHKDNNYSLKESNMQAGSKPVWIPIGESIPEENQKVWVTTESRAGDRECREAVFRDGSYWANKYVTLDLVTKAWMPRHVPEPYSL